MRTLMLAGLVALLASPAAAADWFFEDASVPIAWSDNGTAQFQFACRGGDLAMGYWVRAPHQQVARGTSMNLAISADPSGKGMPGASYAQDMPLIHSDGTSMIVRGPVARAWARIAQQAKQTLRVAYVRKQSGLEIFDAHDFGAAGSNAAISRVLDRCG